MLSESNIGSSKQKTKDALLNAAMEVISQKGFHASTTAEIAKKAGVAEGTIFRYFKSKKDILHTIAIEIAATIIIPMAVSKVKQVLTSDYKSFRELLESLMAERLAFVKKHPIFIKIIIQEISIHPEILSIFRKNFLDQVWPIARNLILKYQKEGEIKKLPPAVVLRIIISLFVGYILPRVILFPDERWDDKKEMQYTIDTLINGIGKR